MSKRSNLVPLILCSLFLCSCSPRDFLTRRLAADLISASDAFRARQQFQLRTGVVSNKEFLSPNYRALQHHGWISGTNAACPAALAPPPCWDVMLTPSGVETFQSLLSPGDAEKQTFTIPAARREVVAITSIAKQGSAADVEFTWCWIPLNEIGAVFYSSDLHFRSTVSFREYDDGWRVVESVARPSQPMDEALKNADSAP